MLHGCVVLSAARVEHEPRVSEGGWGVSEREAGFLFTGLASGFALGVFFVAGMFFGRKP